MATWGTTAVSSCSRAALAENELREARGIIKSVSAELYDLWETSPVRFEDCESHSDEIVDALFPGNPLLCCGESNSKFNTRPRDFWRGKLSDRQLIVPSAMTRIWGVTQDGKRSQHTLDNTGARMYLVVESDIGTVDDQASILLHLSSLAPLALAVHSANKSLHGWFACAELTTEISNLSCATP